MICGEPYDLGNHQVEEWEVEELEMSLKSGLKVESWNLGQKPMFGDVGLMNVIEVVTLGWLEGRAAFRFALHLWSSLGQKS